jgi:hypothetical protein
MIKRPVREKKKEEPIPVQVPMFVDITNLEYSTVIYDVEGVGRFEYTGQVDQNGLVCYQLTH